MAPAPKNGKNGTTRLLGIAATAVAVCGALASGAYWAYSNIRDSGAQQTNSQFIVQKLTEAIDREANDRKAANTRILDIMLEMQAAQKKVVEFQGEALVRDTESKTDRVHLQQSMDSTTKRIDGNVETFNKTIDKIDAKLDRLLQKKD